MWRRKSTAAARLCLYLAMIALEPTTYHSARVLVVSLGRQGDPIRVSATRRRVAALVVAVLAFVTLVFGLSGWARPALWLAAVVVMGPIVIPTALLLVERRVLRRRLDAKYRSEPERPPAADWELSMLAKRPGANVEDATGAALAHARLLGAPSETIGLHARNAALVRHYERHGFRSVPDGFRQMRGTLADVE